MDETTTDPKAIFTEAFDDTNEIYTEADGTIIIDLTMTGGRVMMAADEAWSTRRSSC